MNAHNGWRNVWYESADGLQLYARDYGPIKGGKCPIICLAGITRNSADFGLIAPDISYDRRVVAPDFRGRGLSQYAKSHETYQPDVEMADTVDLMDHLGIDKAVIIGTSRGGLVAMMMAASHKDRLCGVILNDIGPVLEDDGLLGIVDYLGVDPHFSDWKSAADSLKSTNTGINGLEDADWMKFAHRLYKDVDGKPAMNYDPGLAKTFPDAEFIKAGRIPEAWNLFECLKGIPLCTIRGANSELLSKDTFRQMQKVMPDMIAVTVKNRGHVPFLDEPEAMAAIKELLKQVDCKQA